MIGFVAIKWQSYDTWRMRLIFIVLIFAAAGLLPETAAAFDIEESLREQHVQYRGHPDYRAVQSSGMSLSQAIESVRRQTGGKVVSAETRVQGGREVHHIKVLTNGKVKTFKVNGRRR